MGLRSQNNPIASFLDVFTRTGTDAVTPAPIPPILQGLTATGGVISDYTDGPAVYRAHIFTSSGTFDVSAIGDYPADVEYLVVAGGGGGGYEGGGGAGGFRTNQSGHPLSPGNPSFTVTTTSYPVQIGAGAASQFSPALGGNGTDSSFGPITSKGGGGAGKYNTISGSDGGSGGGGFSSGGGGGFGYNPSTPAPVLSGVPLPSPYNITQGNNGGTSAGGGGGAGGAGSTGPGGKGGIGTRTSIAGPSYPIGTPGPGGDGGYLAGGGSGAPGSASPGESAGPDGGGGGYGYYSGFNNPLIHGQGSTGGGGGGGWSGSGNTLQGSGGSGIVVVRYQIGQLTAAKATGGAISYYNGKTIHTFTNSGTFIAPAPISNVEAVVVAGGGGGGYLAGGGGAGGYRYYPNITVPSGTKTVTVGAGGVGGIGPSPATDGSRGGTSLFIDPTYDATGGGGSPTYGNGYNPPTQPGGSGGGARLGDSRASNTGGTGNIGGNDPNSNPIVEGYAGGDATNNGAGGGGAGGVGGPGTGAAGHGGIGVQLPTTFRNPASQPSPTGGGLGAPGPGGGYFWVAGGGGGAYYDNPPHAQGGGPGGPYAGGAPGNSVTSNGWTNTGGGGGGILSGPGISGSGGSGIVLIAYPS